jgi:hypothetical protein
VQLVLPDGLFGEHQITDVDIVLEQNGGLRGSFACRDAMDTKLTYRLMAWGGDLEIEICECMSVRHDIYGKVQFVAVVQGDGNIAIFRHQGRVEAVRRSA